MEDRFSHGHGFASTHWTTIRECAGKGTIAQAARETFCRDYWYPIYAYIRRNSPGGCDPEDLAQDFFLFILNRPWLERADRTKGKFRSFLKVSLDNFLHDQSDHRKAVKRGGEYQHIPIDMGDAPSRYAQSLRAGLPSAEAYEREWVTTVVDLAWQRLEAEHCSSKAQTRFAQLKIFLTISGDAASYESVAEALGVSVQSVKVSVHRLRKRYGAILRDEVARTVSSPDEVANEMQHIRAVFTLKSSAAA